jgi:hypothetical protein
MIWSAGKMVTASEIAVRRLSISWVAQCRYVRWYPV